MTKKSAAAKHAKHPPAPPVSLAPSAMLNEQEGEVKLDDVAELNDADFTSLVADWEEATENANSWDKIRKDHSVLIQDKLRALNIEKLRVRDNLRVSVVTVSRPGTLDPQLLIQHGVKPTLIAKCTRPGTVSYYAKLVHLKVEE